MTTFKKIGNVQKIPYEIQQIEWRIPDFFTVANEGKYLYFASPAFSVRGVLWHLRLWPKWNLSAEFMDLYLAHEAYDINRSDGNLAPGAYREYIVEYYFGLKKCDENEERFVSGIITKSKCKSSIGKFIKKTQLLEQMSELVPGNILTIVCTMKWVAEVSHCSTQPTAVLEKTKPLKLISKF